MNLPWLLWPIAVVLLATAVALAVWFKSKKRSDYTSPGSLCGSKGLVNDSSGRGCISKAYCESNMNAQHNNAGNCTCAAGYQWDGLNKVCFINLPRTTEQNIAICQSKGGHIWKTPKGSSRERGNCVARALNMKPN
jgi:hypothetical protein